MSGLVRKHPLHKLTIPYIVRLVCPCPKYSVLQNSVSTFSVDIYCCDDEDHTGANHRVTAAAADLISGLIARKAENSFSVRNVYNVRNVYSAPAPNITADLHTTQGHSAGHNPSWRTLSI